MPIKDVIILRGLPGSGKTTLFHQRYKSALEVGSVIHCSADSFFYVPVDPPKMLLTVENELSPEQLKDFKEKWSEQIKLTEKEPIVISTAPLPKPVLPPEMLEYKFNPSLLPQAHTVCMGVFIKALENGLPYVVLDNTCSQLWEYRNYVAMAEAFGYDVHILSLPIPQTLEEAKAVFERQTHGVPLDIFLKMWWRWESDSREEIVEVETFDEDEPEHD